jgi:hypothetical protein
MARTIIYTIWLSLPVFYLLMALWSALEKVGNKEKRESPTDQLRQALFCLVCAGIAILIDQYLLEDLANALIPSWLTLLFYQVFLYPVVLYLGAMALGPSKEILITKAPNPTKRRTKK